MPVLPTWNTLEHKLFRHRPYPRIRVRSTGPRSVLRELFGSIAQFDGSHRVSFDPPRSMLADKSFSVAPRKRPGGCCLGACFAQSDPDSQSQTPLFINKAIYAWWVYIRICCECIGSNPLDGAFFSRPDSWCTNLLRILPSSQEKGTTTRRRHYVMKRLGGRTTSPCTCGRQVLQAEKRASFEC